MNRRTTSTNRRTVHHYLHRKLQSPRDIVRFLTLRQCFTITSKHPRPSYQVVYSPAKVQVPVLQIHCLQDLFLLPGEPQIFATCFTIMRATAGIERFSCSMIFQTVESPRLLNPVSAVIQYYYVKALLLMMSVQHRLIFIYMCYNFTLIGKTLSQSVVLVPANSLRTRGRDNCFNAYFS